MRKLGLFMLICACALALFACGGGSNASSEDLANSKYVGTWKVDTISFKDQSETFDTEWTIILEADGTGKSISTDESGDFTWELTNNGFKTKGSMNTEFVDDGDAITTTVIGATLSFNKVE